MTQPQPDANAAPPEGNEPPVAPPYAGGQYPPAPQTQQPYAAPQQGYPAGPQQPYQQPQYSSQPPMPNPAYGYPQPKSKLVAGLLGIFLGGIGIHRFYLGFTKIAVIQLILTLVLGIFTFGLVGLWGVVEGIMIIAGSSYFRTDAQGIPLRD